jgi:predicted phosphodiesterase
MLVKKVLKKIVSVVLVMMLVLVPVIPVASALTPPESAHLSFGADGKFTIMQFADIQDGPGLLTPTANFIKRALSDVKPDLVILTGDNIMGALNPTQEAAKGAICKVMDIFQAAGVKVAAVFGNHDDESTKATKEFQMSVYMSYNCFVGYDEGGDIYGVGNYNIPIYSSTDPAKTAYNLWLFDSGTYDSVNGGYDYVHQSQIDWYVHKSNELKAANGGVPVKSMIFQHIVVPEVYETFTEVPYGTPGAVAKYGKYYVLNPALTRAGVLGEAACPPHFNGGQFAAVKAQGDVAAMFFGHDHVNSYEVNCKGIDLVCTPTAGMASYGDSTRGARVITIDENNTSSYETHIVAYTDYFKTDSIFNLLYAVMYEFWAIAFPVENFISILDSMFSLSIF